MLHIENVKDFHGSKSQGKIFARKREIGQPLHSYSFIIPYYREIFNRKNKIFFSKKKKSRKPFSRLLGPSQNI